MDEYVELCTDPARNPQTTGVYVAYVDSEDVRSFRERKMLIWIEGRWGYCNSDQNYRGKVYGWVGPLPALKA